jgi:tetratricopeptide (TPR) repeat protein
MLEEAIVIRPDHIPSYNNLAKAYFLAGIPELAAASYQEALHHDPSNAIARKNLALLTAAGGVQAAPGPGDTARPAAEARRPQKAGTPAPSVAVAGGTEKPSVPPEAGREVRDEADAEALREMLRSLPHVTVERRGDRLALSGWTGDERSAAAGADTRGATGCHQSHDGRRR